MKTRVLVLITVLAAMLAVSQLSAHATGHDPVVYQAQIRFYTGSIENAGTDDPVYVSLRSNNLTWLDHTGNDWQRGSNEKWYGLLLNGVNRLSDISRIEIGKTGSDGWCIHRIDVVVNRELLYREELPGRQCRWLDNGGGHSTTYTIGASAFRAINDRPPLTQISSMKLENIIETAAGNFMAQNSLYWGDRGSISIRSLRDVLHVDLKMRWEFNDSTDPAVDMSYELKLDCQNNRITISVKYPSVHTGRFVGIGKGVIGSDDSPLMYETAAHLQDIIRRHTAGCGAFFHEFHGPELYLGAPGS